MDIRSRQDKLVRLMRRSGHVSIEELASAAVVSKRTVLRDIASLREQGFVIHSESGKGGGVCLDPSSIQMTAKLSATEIMALLISVAVMRATQSLPFSEVADCGLAKIERMLPRDRAGELREILERLHIGAPTSEELRATSGKIDPDLLPAFETAFIQRHRMQIGYVDRQSRATLREIEPLAMLVLPPIWYLVGYDNDKDGFRHFRMDRIKNPKIIMDSKFRRRSVSFTKDVCPYFESAGRA